MIRFRSRAAADIHMLDAHAYRLLELMGKPRQARGALDVDEIEGALALLRKAVAQEKTETAPPGDDPEERDEATVDLARRAWPLIEMLERAARRGKAVSWGI